MACGGDDDDVTIDAPTLLVTAPGWRVSWAGEYGDDTGEMRVTNGEREIELHWQPAKYHDKYVDDRRRGSEAEWPLKVAGYDTVLFKYKGRGDFTAMWLQDDWSMELRGMFSDVDTFRAVARSIVEVGQDAWLAAMPADVVTPDERPHVVDRMLEGVPVHPEVDVAALQRGNVIVDYAQLGGDVAAAVSCAWTEQWVTATRSGDDRRAREARRVMVGAREWPIMQELHGSSAWAATAWKISAAIETGALIDYYGMNEYGEPISVAASYESALGCDRF